MLFILSCILVFVSCDADKSTDSEHEQTLKVVSNISNTSSKALNDIEISEVLLRFHSDGPFDGKSNFNLDDPYAFYVDYIGEDASYHTDYGMYFNTVLYVPDVIRDVYVEMKGKDPDSGNPFWWYMEVFLDKDLNEIRSSWKTTAKELLGEEGKELPFPKTGNAKDERWRKRSSFVQYSPFFFDESSTVVTAPAYQYLKIEEHWDGMFLYLPAGLVQAYLERGGDYINNTEAFYWYMDKYQGVSRDEIDRMVTTGELESFLKKLTYTAPQKDDGKTVDESCYTIVSTNITNRPNGEGKTVASVYIYSSNNNLQFKDGRVIDDRNKMYFVDSSSTDFIVFVPDSFCTKYTEVTGTAWNFASADSFWSLLSLFGLSPDGEGYKSIEGEGTYFTREYIEKNILTKGIEDIKKP